MLLLMLVACGSNVELRGELAPRQDEVDDLAGDMLPDLSAWHIIVDPEPEAFICAQEISVGCTALSIKKELAHLRLALADGWTLKQTAFRHEMTHVWLAATIGDGDRDHINEVWNDR